MCARTPCSVSLGNRQLGDWAGVPHLPGVAPRRGTSRRRYTGEQTLNVAESAWTVPFLSFHHKTVRADTDMQAHQPS